MKKTLIETLIEALAFSLVTVACLYLAEYILERLG